MGVCLCKDKYEDGHLSIGNNNNNYTEATNMNNNNNNNRQHNHNIDVNCSARNTGINNNENINLNNNRNNVTDAYRLSETVDRLVKETLDVIGTIVDNEPEPPISMVHLHDITDKPTGWIQLVKSLINVIPTEHPMGPSVITLLLDDSPLPSKDSVLEVANMIVTSVRWTPRCKRNFCVILGCLAEKLAGPSSVAVLSETTLEYLIRNLDEGINPDVTLFSLIALEKFAQKSENKTTIKRKLAQFNDNPLLRLEMYSNSTDFLLRQVGFCAKWCLDNHFIIEGRKYSYELTDTTHVNVMLNTKDVSEYLKISPDGLEARCDAYSFESVRCTYQINSGCWYYEVLIINAGVMQIGWATKDSNFLSHEGYGIGDDQYSIAFDGCRRLLWHNAKSISYDLPIWHGGSILGCLLDLDAKEVIFSLDGAEGGILKQVFGNAKDGFFAAASFMSFQQCRFNFGAEPFMYPPKTRRFQSFNQYATMKPQDKIVIPRHLFLEQLRKLSVREDSCTLCFDMKGTIRIEPCKHSGFCSNCIAQLQYCPMCRGDIVLTVQEEILTTPESITSTS